MSELDIAIWILWGLTTIFGSLPLLIMYFYAKFVGISCYKIEFGLPAVIASMVPILGLILVIITIPQEVEFLISNKEKKFPNDWLKANTIVEKFYGGQTDPKKPRKHPFLDNEPNVIEFCRIIIDAYDPARNSQKGGNVMRYINDFVITALQEIDNDDVQKIVISMADTGRKACFF